MNISEQQNLLEFLPKGLNQNMLESSLHKDVKNTLINCLSYCLDTTNDTDSNKTFEIESVIDYLHDELNTGHWSEVPLQTRQHFTCASYLKCIILLKSKVISEPTLKDCLKCLDLGLLLGAPLDDNEILPKSASYLSQILNGLQNSTEETLACDNKSWKRSIDSDSYDSYRLIKAQEVLCEECPTLERFNKINFINQIPLKLKGIFTKLLNNFCFKISPAFVFCRLYVPLASFCKMAGRKLFIANCCESNSTH